MHQRIRIGLLAIAASTACGLGCGGDSPEGSGDDVADGAGPDAPDTGGDAAELPGTGDVGGDGGDVAEAGDAPDAPSEDVPPDADPPVCGDRACEGGESPEDCPEDCAPNPVVLFHPATGELSVFPDDFYTRADPDSATGLRPVMNPSVIPWLRTIPVDFLEVFTDMERLDGWGTTAGAFVQFSRSLDPETVPSGVETRSVGSAVFMGYLDDGDLVPVPVETLLTDEGATIVLRPMVPLPPAHRAVAWVTRAVLGTDAREAQPNPAMQSLLGREADGDLARMNERYDEALAAIAAAGGPAAEELAALTVFTTQTIFDESLRVAADIRGREYTIAERLGCEDRASYRACTVTFDSGNYRTPEREVAPGPNGEPLEFYRLHLDLYLPLAAGEFGGPPYPTVIFGHGLNGARDQATRLAEFAAPLGIATLAIDAPEHGDHPVRAHDSEILSLFDFFGLSTIDASLDPTALRDNWRQAAWDKLALVELLRNGVDADGDGSVEVDADRLGYLGVSLGAIMGPEFLAMSHDIDAAVLVVGGARVTDILQFSTTFAPLIQLLAPQSVSDGEIARFWVALQTAIDRGDSGNFAPYVAMDRLDESDPVQVLAAMVIDDDIVPEASNMELGRALGGPHVDPVLRPLGVLEAAGPAPFSGNLPGGGTAGFVQFDWVQDGDGNWEPATHNNIGDSEVGAASWLAFLEGVLRDGSGVIIDPWAALGLTPPRE